jgi:hypothetical protein
MISSRHHQHSSLRAWAGPAAGIALLAIGMLVFGLHLADHWDTYSRRYAAAAFVIGIFPQIPAIALLLGLGRGRDRDEATFAQTIVALGAGGIGLLFLGWAGYLLAST